MKGVSTCEGVVRQPGSSALVGSGQLSRERTLTQSHGEDFPRDVGELETGHGVQAADGMQGRQVACFQAHAWIPLGAFNSLTFPPPVGGGCDGPLAPQSSLAASCSQSKWVDSHVCLKS